MPNNPISLNVPYCKVFDPRNAQRNGHQEVDPNTYVDDGVEKNVPVGRWTIQSVSLDGQGNIDIQFGDMLYQDSRSAIKDLPKYTNARCFVVVKQGATDMSNANQIQVLEPPDNIPSPWVTPETPLNQKRRQKF